MRWVAILVLAAALGCGKRGDPLPPLARTPQPVRDLTVAQRGSDLEIRYTAPRTTTGGVRLDLHAVEILTARAEGDFAKTARIEVRKAAPGETVAWTQPLPPPVEYLTDEQLLGLFSPELGVALAGPPEDRRLLVVVSRNPGTGSP